MVWRRCTARWLLKVIVVCLFSTSVHAQRPPVIISGYVTSESSEPLAGATVILLSRSDSAFVAYTLTGEEGNFKFEAAIRPAEGWLLKARSIGYAATFFPVGINLENIQLVLTPVGEQLQEITVAERLPIKARKDTVLYRGEAFRDSTERKVSELLDKLPGVEVNDVGDVKVNGQAIRTVLIDGDNLLDNNYQVLTNNLDADVVEDVEIIYNYLDNPLLATVFEGRDIAVNLLTSASKRRRINLSALAGLGTTGRYDLEGNVIGLYDRLKSVTFLSHNNLGDAIPHLSQNPLPVSDFALQSLLQPGKERLEQVNITGSPDPTRLNSVGFLSSVAHLTLAKNWRLRASIVAPTDDYELINTTHYDYAGDSTDQRRNLHTSGKQELKAYSISLRKDVPERVRYEIKTTLLGIRQQQNTNFGQGEIYDNSGRYNGIGLRGVMTRKLGERTLGIMDVAFQSTNETMNHTLSDPLRGVLTSSYDVRVDSLRQKQVYQPRTVYFSGKLLAQVRKTRVILTSGANLSTGRFNFSGANGRFDRLDRKELFISSRVEHYLTKTVKAKVTTRGGVIDIMGLGEVDARLPYFTLSANLEKEWNIMKHLRVSFLSGRMVPEELRAVSTPRYRSRYLITEGNPQLQNALNTSRRLSVDFTTGNVFPHRSFSVKTTLNRGEQGYLPDYRIVGNTTIASWRVGERSRNAYSLGARGEYFIGLISSTVKINLDYRTDRYQTLLAAEPNNVNASTLNWRASLKTGIDIPINFAAGIERVYSVLKPENTASFTSLQTLPYLDLILISGGRLSARWSNNWQLLKVNQQTSRNLIADAEFGYRLPGKVSRLGVRLYNVFNTDNISSTQVYDFGQITRSSAVRSRYILFSAEMKW